MNLLAWQRNLRPFLFPAAKAYAALMQLRRLGYETGLLASGSLAAPCVSVGNICWGGSGKTPITAWLLAWAHEQGMRPVVLTRGYHAKPPALPYLVRTDSPTQEAGDEPLLLLHTCPEANILVDPKRLRAGLWAAGLHPDLFVLDDGMQHLSVRRDINLVLLRESDLDDQWNRVIPAGSWREPKSALQRASAFLIKCAYHDPEDVLATAEKKLECYHKAVFTFFLHARSCVAVQDGTEAVPPLPYLIATGIADPTSVAHTAQKLLHIPPKIVLAFTDHHDFDHADWKKIMQECERHAVKSILCTPKDAVKLRKFKYSHLYTFDMTLEFGPYSNSPVPFPTWMHNYLGTCLQKSLDNGLYSNK